MESDTRTEKSVSVPPRREQNVKGAYAFKFLVDERIGVGGYVRERAQARRTANRLSSCCAFVRASCRHTTRYIMNSGDELAHDLTEKDEDGELLTSHSAKRK